MFQISLINSVRNLEKRIEVEKQQIHHRRKWSHQSTKQVNPTRKKPAAERELTIIHTSLVNALQIWEKRWQAEEDQRNQRVRAAETSQETFLRRLPRLKIGHAKDPNETAKFHSCCQATSDYQNALRS
jgi:hypothetical protein